MAQIIVQLVMDKVISIQNRWNATGRGNGHTRRKSTRSATLYSEKFCMDWTGIKPGTQRLQAAGSENCSSVCPAITVDKASMGTIQDSSNLFSANW
jgi:hypothetical protein